MLAYDTLRGHGGHGDSHAKNASWHRCSLPAAWELAQPSHYAEAAPPTSKQCAPVATDGTTVLQRTATSWMAAPGALLAAALVAAPQVVAAAEMRSPCKRKRLYVRAWAPHFRGKPESKEPIRLHKSRGDL